jgi:Protein of unknown function (DUF3617)
MTRQLFSFRLAATVLVWTVSALAASAIEMPTRKAGLWEVKALQPGSATLQVTAQQCTDETIDKQMTAYLPASKEFCSRNDVQKTAAGYTTDYVCTINGVSMTSHLETTGDFNSAYTVKLFMHYDGGQPAVTMTIEAKWLGPCAAGQRPGDIVMPGGYKTNITDTKKLKDVMPAK